MKKQLLLGLILVAMVAVALAVYLIVGGIQNKENSKAIKEAKALQLSTLDSSAITSMDIHTPEQDYEVSCDDNGDWGVDNDEDLRVNTYYLSTLASYAASVTASDNLGELDSSTMESYELKDPITITMHTDSDTQTLYIGKETSTGEYFYMMNDKSDDVYLVDADTAGYLYVTQTQMRYRYVMDDTSMGFKQFKMIKDGEEVFEFQKEDSETWRLTGPIETPLPVDGSQLENLYTKINTLEIDDFGDSGITEDKYAEYGFDDPEYIYQFTTEDDTVYTLYFPKFNTNNVSYVDALRVETGEIYTFESSYLTFLQVDLSTYMTTSILSPSYSDANTLEFKYKGTYNDKNLDIDTTITWDYENSTYAIDGKELDADDSDAIKAFTQFYDAANAVNYYQLSSSFKEPDISGKTPDLTLTYTLNDGTTTEMELYRKDDEKNMYWVFVNGEFTYTDLRQRALSLDDRILDCYTEMMEYAN